MSTTVKVWSLYTLLDSHERRSTFTYEVATTTMMIEKHARFFCLRLPFVLPSSSLVRGHLRQRFVYSLLLVATRLAQDVRDGLLVGAAVSE